MNDVIERIPLEKIHPHPANRPNGGFDEKKLQELAESIKAVGVLQAAVVRPHKGEYQLVAGERRWRASKLAGLDYLPCTVKELDDVTTLKIQIIENLQREDVCPLDEADGYDRLMREASYSVELIAQEVGRSLPYVYQRLKLKNLIPELRDLLVEGKLSTAHALTIARLDSEQQKAIMDEHFSSRSDLESPITVRELNEWIHREILMELSKVPWKIDDEELLPEAGTCTACAKRTGSTPALFEDLGKKDYCEDKDCFRRKAAAIVARRREELAETEHLEVRDGYAPGRAAKGILERYDWEECKKKDPGAVRVLVVEGMTPGRLTWGKPVNHGGQKAPANETPQAKAERQAEAKKEKLQEKARKASNRRIFDVLIDVVDSKLEKNPRLQLSLLRLAVRGAWQRLGIDAQTALSKVHDWGKPEDAYNGYCKQGEKRILSMGDEGCLSFLVECALAGSLQVGHYDRDPVGPILREAAAALSVDIEEIRSSVYAELGAELEEIEEEREEEEDEGKGRQEE